MRGAPSLLFFAATATATALAGAGAGCSRSHPEEGWLTARAAPEIRGLDVARNAPFDLRAHRGKVVLLSFGYTHCAEVCPDTFAKAKAVRRALGDAIEFVYVTVDPERDRPEVLREFMRAVDPRFAGVYADGDDLAKMLADYQVTVRKRLPEPGREDLYAMDHSSGFWGIDGRGELRFRLPHDTGEDELRTAASRLVEGGEP